MDPEKINYHYCDALPTAPLPENKKILITGASGYVARRLIPELVSRGYFIRRLPRKKYAQLYGEIFTGLSFGNFTRGFSNRC